jgi:hypothetical protein
MFNVEFIAFDDWQPHARVVRRLPADYVNFDQAIDAGTMMSGGTVPGSVGFRVVESNLKGAQPARIVAHRFRGL